MRSTLAVIIVTVATIAIVAAGGWTETIWGRVASLLAFLSLIVVIVAALVRYLWVPGEGIHTDPAGASNDWHKLAPGHEDKAKDL